MEWIDALKRHLSGIADIPATEWLHLAKLLHLRQLAKDAFFFRQGEPVGEMAFVVRGLLYNYWTNANDERFVKYFIPENNVVACYSSLLKQEPAAYTSVALEKTTLVTIDYAAWTKLYERHVCWERVARVSTEKLYIEKEEREQHFLMADAKTRYEAFVKDRTDLMSRVPQYLIASYIGITPVSLSRIRRG